LEGQKRRRGEGKEEGEGLLQLCSGAEMGLGFPAVKLRNGWNQWRIMPVLLIEASEKKNCVLLEQFTPVIPSAIFAFSQSLQNINTEVLNGRRGILSVLAVTSNSLE